MSLLGIDVGTSGCKSVVFSLTGQVMAEHYCGYDTRRDETGRSEVDARDLWNKIAETIRVCVTKTKGDPITAISVTSMGESMVPLDAEGRICGPSILGSDLRMADEAVNCLASRYSADELYRITQSPFCTGYSFTTLYFMRHGQPDYWNKVAWFLPWADFVVWKLTGNAMVDYALAERTYCFDMKAKQWSTNIMESLGLTCDKLPQAYPSGTIAGCADTAAARDLGLPSTAQVVLGAHDQCACMLGAGIGSQDGAMLGLGTFACMSIAHQEGTVDGAYGRIGLNLEHLILPEHYASFIYHGSGGALVKWMRQQFFRDYDGEDAYSRMDAELSTSKQWPVVLPYFAETGPYRHQAAGNGVMAELSLETTRADLFKGAMAGVIFYFRDALDDLAEAATRIRDIRITGGGARSAVWRQLAADILQRPIIKTVCTECGALGCAINAAVAAGCYGDFDSAIAAMVRTEVCCEPQKASWQDRWYESYLAKRKLLMK